MLLAPIPRWLAIAGLLIGSQAGSQDPAPNQPAPEFPAGVEVVVVDVVVLDKEGNPIEDLRREDFKVREDGQPQTATSFEPVSIRESPASPPPSLTRVSTNGAPTPRPERHFVIVFDDLHLTAYTAPRAREAARAFIETSLGDGDVATLVRTAGGAWWTERLPEGRADLLAVVDRLESKRQPDSGVGRLSDFEALQIHFNRDRQALAQVARRYFENGLIVEAVPQDAQIRRELDVSPGLSLIRAKATQTYTELVGRLRGSLDALERVAASLAGTRGRKVVLVLSDGFVFDQTQPEFRELVQAARRANAAVYFVDARGQDGGLGQPGLPGGGAEFGRAAEEQDATSLLAQTSREIEGARSVAVDTGGSIITGTNRLMQGMQRIAAESRTYYLLGYTSSNTRRDGKFRKIDIAVSRPDVQVRARRGYYAPKDGEVPRRGEGDLDPRVRATLDAPAGVAGIPLRMTSYVVGPAEDGKVTVLLAAEADVRAIDLRPDKEQRWTGAVQSYVVVASRETGANQNQEKVISLSLPSEVKARLEKTWLPIFRDFRLGPGTYQARLLLKDRETGRMGMVRHKFEVEDPTAFRTSTPILTDTLETDPLRPQPRPVPLARDSFRAGGRLYCLYEVFGARPDPGTGRPRVAAGYRVRGAQGAVIMNRQPAAITPGPQGQLSQMLALTLPSATPGDYELILTVRDEVGGTTLDWRGGFTIEP